MATTDELIYLASPYSDWDFEYQWQRFIDVNKVVAGEPDLGDVELVYSPIAQMPPPRQTVSDDQRL